MKITTEELVRIWILSQVFAGAGVMLMLIGVFAWAWWKS